MMYLMRVNWTEGIFESHVTRAAPGWDSPRYSEKCGVQIDNSSLNKLESSVVKLSFPSYARLSLQNRPSRILYLIQTEECLPSQLRVALGNSSACQCDVVVLSYKSMCNDTSLPHVRYLFNSSTTWTTGRNLLFYTNIYKRCDRYLYYIMMDDDVHLSWRKEWKQTFKDKDPWRSFEEFLRRTQPAVAAVEVKEEFLIHIEEIHKTRQCYMDPEYTPTVKYDPAFNAFHYQAVEYMLPYWDQLDHISWWYSQVFQYVWSEVVFHGQVVVHTQLRAINQKHRPYPRLAKFNSVLPVMVENIRNKLPAECHNAHLLEKCEKMGFRYILNESSTYCMPPPPPNQTIIPFKYFVC